MVEPRSLEHRPCGLPRGDGYDTSALRVRDDAVPQDHDRSGSSCVRHSLNGWIGGTETTLQQCCAQRRRHQHVGQGQCRQPPASPTVELGNEEQYGTDHDTRHQKRDRSRHERDLDDLDQELHYSMLPHA